MVSEPLNVRKEFVRQRLNITDHGGLFGEKAWLVIKPYFREILRGKVTAFRPHPFSKSYRLVTSRTVIKMNQGGGTFLPRIQESTGCLVVHLLRHPIPVALSREVFPLLDTYDRSDLRDRFSEAENITIDQVIRTGSKLERGVVAWILHHRPVLEDSQSTWLTVHYEECVLNPDRFLSRLSAFLGEPVKDIAAGKINQPSAVARKSDLETQQILEGKKPREDLVNKWRNKVTEEEIRAVEQLLSEFRIGCYQAANPLPIRGTESDSAQVIA